MLSEDLKASRSPLGVQKQQQKIMHMNRGLKFIPSIHPIHFFGYLLCEVVDNPGQCFCHDFSVPAQFLHIDMRPGRHRQVCRATVRLEEEEEEKEKNKKDEEKL